MVAVTVWATALEHKRVLFQVDNVAVVRVGKWQSARDPFVLKLLGVFVLRCLKHDILFQVRHVPGVDNDIADAWSRSQWQRCHGLATEADVDRTPVLAGLSSVGERGSRSW